MNEDIDYELTISDAVWSAVGLDDSARYPDIVRIATRGGFRCLGKREALIDLVTEISDRATEGADGFNEPADVKRECRRTLRKLAENGWKPRA